MFFSGCVAMSQSFTKKPQPVSQSPCRVHLISYDRSNHVLHGNVSGLAVEMLSNDGLRLYVTNNGQQLLLVDQDNVQVNGNKFSVKLDKYPSSMIENRFSSNNHGSIVIYIMTGKNDQVKSDSINL